MLVARLSVRGAREIISTKRNHLPVQLLKAITTQIEETSQ